MTRIMCYNSSPIKQVKEQYNFLLDWKEPRKVASNQKRKEQVYLVHKNIQFLMIKQLINEML